MITRDGPQKWANVHVTAKAKVADLILVDNSAPAGTPQPNTLDALRQAARDLDQLVQQARQQGVRVRALGSGWALSDIAVTDGWLINTKGLNGCFEVSTKFFDTTYPDAERPFVVLAQAGISIAELNVYLEVTGFNGLKRALKTSGIGAGQTVAGSISGNTHGSGIQFGSTPDYVAGFQLVTGTGKSWWIERASKPVLNDAFVAALGAEAIRDDEVFNAAIVSFGCFGIITAMAIETAPIFHLEFPPVVKLDHAALKQHLGELATIGVSDPAAPYHYEFVFDPYDKKKIAMETSARKVPYEPGHATPAPVWIARDKNGFALGTDTAKLLLETPLVSSAKKAALQFDLYHKRAILDGVRGTPGQVFTATIFYFEGYTESALGVSVDDAPAMIDICCDIVKKLDQPCISQVRLVHPSHALLGFTRHGPKTAVFEFGLLNDANFPIFDRELTNALKAANIPYTFHWSKNSGLDRDAVLHMYGADRVARWRAARDRLFQGDAALRRVFDSPLLERAGLA
ncbi:MAG: FAD-binding protein [Gemmatimonadales bacterium]|nr:FAD-binding protein [Gemmatimonadales bacterium]